MGKKEIVPEFFSFKYLTGVSHRGKPSSSPLSRILQVLIRLRQFLIAGYSAAVPEGLPRRPADRAARHSNFDRTGNSGLHSVHRRSMESGKSGPPDYCGSREPTTWYDNEYDETRTWVRRGVCAVSVRASRVRRFARRFGMADRSVDRALRCWADGRLAVARVVGAGDLGGRGNSVACGTGTCGRALLSVLVVLECRVVRPLLR